VRVRETRETEARKRWETDKHTGTRGVRESERERASERASERERESRLGSCGRQTFRVHRNAETSLQPLEFRIVVGDR
jgi:ribosome assembly protein YihI (activator of Der GTPase)